MNGPVPLFGPPTANPGALTPRQVFVYELVRDRAPIDADEVGAHLCERAGRHGADERCDWDARNGRQALTSKGLRPLVKKRRGGGWVLRHEAPKRETGYDPATAAFPEGF